MERFRHACFVFRMALEVILKNLSKKNRRYFVKYTNRFIFVFAFWDYPSLLDSFSWKLITSIF